jgi:hypothetical protein
MSCTGLCQPADVRPPDQRDASPRKRSGQKKRSANATSTAARARMHHSTDTVLVKTSNVLRLLCPGSHWQLCLSSSLDGSMATSALLAQPTTPACSPLRSHISHSRVTWLENRSCLWVASLEWCKEPGLSQIRAAKQ